MIKRLLFAVIFLLLPLGAMADDAATSAGLGPGTTSSVGGSNADAASLQPAGLSPVQAATPDQGMGAPASPLQAPAASGSQLSILNGEADGSPHQPGDQPAALWPWLYAGLALAVIAAAIVVVRDRRRFRKLEI